MKYIFAYNDSISHRALPFYDMLLNWKRKNAHKAYKICAHWNTMMYVHHIFRQTSWTNIDIILSTVCLATVCIWTISTTLCWRILWFFLTYPIFTIKMRNKLMKFSIWTLTSQWIFQFDGQFFRFRWQACIFGSLV